ncbi:MAG TPA: TIM barrel protein [Flexivirga sp.]|uniref:sugar phosphate isomerase/epimerase family protein n=1 Tax=Flexivirga sp. TaxID=1962927 RepID=UPI002BCB1EE9|nr:TIM barrel protein [Flexivirga sp.]HWC21278.1 TIM barrel protein [Flexivirga sp.]
MSDESASADWIDRTGICSVTFRRLAPPALVDVTAAAGLRCIEWGSDIHAPADDPRALDEVRRYTLDAGLTVSSYGSYWRAGERSSSPSIEELVSGAVRLGAPRLRVWAGSVGSAECPTPQRNRIVADLRRAAEVGADSGIRIGLEFHRLTLTDTVESTLRLLDEVGHDNLATYWQPRVDEPAGDAIEGLRRLVDRVCAVHVFSWWPFAERLPLTDRADLWRGVTALLRASTRPMDLLLEFVPDDDPAVLSREAETLQSWLSP